MTKREAKKMFGSYSRIAQVLGINRSCIGRWKRGVPKKRAEQLTAIWLDEKSERAKAFLEKRSGTY